MGEEENEKLTLDFDFVADEMTHKVPNISIYGNRDSRSRIPVVQAVFYTEISRKLSGSTPEEQLMVPRYPKGIGLSCIVSRLRKM